jgi:hypothetical protein
MFFSALVLAAHDCTEFRPYWPFVASSLFKKATGIAVKERVQGTSTNGPWAGQSLKILT